ncbi:MAG: NADH-quinone oxidoreductase subunit N [Cytophagales bacterium]|nr:NADH-quinone oxidoreductase subunit N [Armatimonadota bacterium]
MNQSVLTDLQALICPLVVIVLGMIVLLLDLGTGDGPARRRLIYFVSLGGLVAAALLAVANTTIPNAGVGVTPLTHFGGGMVADRFGGLFCIVLCIIAGLAITMSDRYLEEKSLNSGEYYALILFSTSGAMLMALAYDLVNIFVGLEILSVALYILSGFARRERRSEESAVKYFLLGSFASGFLLYGMALIYGAVGIALKNTGLLQPTGTSFTNLGVIARTIQESAETGGAPITASPLFIAGVALLIVGLAFKAAIVPFHSYAPDVYEGAPTPVTAFMSAAAKVGAFAALIRVFGILLPADNASIAQAAVPFHAVLWGLAAATIVVGNVLAIRQTNIKRMLAYSSIAHAGYILVGVLASSVPGASQNAKDAVIYYLFTYTFMNLGAFAMVIWLGRDGGEYTSIADYAGLAKQQPLAAAAMAVFMLSLAGIPPAAGFLAKLYVFTSAVQAGLTGLAVLALVVSVIGVYYYLNIIVAMYFRDPVNDFSSVRAGGARAAALLSAAATLLFGFIPAGVFSPTIQRDQPTAQPILGAAEKSPLPPAVAVVSPQP